MYTESRKECHRNPWRDARIDETCCERFERVNGRHDNIPATESVPRRISSYIVSLPETAQWEESTCERYNVSSINFNPLTSNCSLGEGAFTRPSEELDTGSAV